jgi:hypothetical protein
MTRSEAAKNIRKMREFRRKVTASQETARQALRDAGIMTENNEISDPYKTLFSHDQNMTEDEMRLEIDYQRELIIRAINSAISTQLYRVMQRYTGPKTVWELCKNIFGFGSSFSIEICKKYGFDPDQIIGQKIKGKK